ncbi:hypothetical protein GCM10027446_11390 [Angustibacter peucedani]
MQTTSRRTVAWVTPAVSALIGVVYFVAFWLGGHRGSAFFGLGLMLAVAVGLLLVRRRSETVQGLLDRQDERITDIDLRATAFTASAMIAAVLVGFVVQVARDADPFPYVVVGAVGGLAYLLALVVLRVRG